MKRLPHFLALCILLVSATLHAQYNYTAQWKKADDLIQKKNLPKSALAIVKKIYAQAKKEGNEPQRIKALIYQLDLQEETREENGIASIREVEKELKESKEPYTSVLNSMLAGLYWNYFQQHRWQLYNRTATEKVDSTDITKWSAAEFHTTISALYLASLQNKSGLQQTPLETFSIIIVKGNVPHLRPTLYDLLAQKALSYFENDEQYITRPEYRFELSEPKLLAPAKEFTSLQIATTDTASLQFKALQIYQDLLRLHANDKIEDALIDADIQRIGFAYRNAVMEEKDSLYKEALQSLMKEHAGNKAASQAGYLLAEYYNNLANDYHPFRDTAHRFERIKAEAILQKIVADSAVKAEGWINSYNLLQQIRKPSLSVEVEKVNLPGEPFRALVKYKNIPQVYAKVVASSKKLADLLEDLNEDEYWKILAQQKPVKAWQQNLPATNDLQEHSVEIKVDALPAGQYFLVLSSDANASKKSSTAAANHVWVSNISYVNRDNDFFVLHRKTGEPLAGATVEVIDKDYNSRLAKNILKVRGKYAAGEQGFLRVKVKDPSYDSYLRFRYKNETLSLNDEIYLNRNSDDEVRTRDYFTKVFFYTDRSLYRPGQAVFFKAILVRDAGKAAKTILANYAVTVYLYDANSQKKDSLKLTSNEYGSVNGKFNLPSNLLNGNFSLRTKLEGYDSQTSFSVEEYKRPKFYVEFDKIKDEYKIGDSIHLTLTAKAYAGNNVSGAKVSYQVMRSNRCVWTKRWVPGNNQQIAHGEKQTGDDGKLVVSFIAEPDKAIDTATHPVFDYDVTATITDINGETHSETESISVGYTSLVLTATVPEKIAVDSVPKLFIGTQNLNGEFTEAPLVISVYKLTPENRMLRARYWEEPDQAIMSKEDYVKQFPFDEYKNESDYTTWPRSLIQTTSSKSTEKGELPVNWPNPAAGHYLIAVTVKDKDGIEVKTEIHTEIFNSASITKTEFLWVYNPDRSLQPGEGKDVLLASSAANIYLIKESDRVLKKLDDVSRFDYQKLSEERKAFRLDATEEDRGGYNFAFLFIKENRVHHYDNYISVPWSNKQLAVEFSSFRDKTEPGTKELVKVKIKGEGGKKAAAEMLASMYDASLDAMQYHNWSVPPLWWDRQFSLTWTEEDFATAQSEDKEIELGEKYFDKVFDAFLFERNGLWWLNAYRYTYMLGYGKLGLDERRRSVPPPPIETAKFVANIKAVPQKQSMSYSVGFNSNDMSPTRGNNYKRQSLGEDVMGDWDSFKKPSYDPYDLDINRQKKIDIQPRKNLSETAFFLPFLTTNENGDIEFSFTAPEALTKWKLQTFAHTKDLAFGLREGEVITQKTLMVQPNVPRFIRQKDAFTLQSKIANLSDKKLEGTALLQLFDAATSRPLGKDFFPSKDEVKFSLEANGSTVVNFSIQIPEAFTSSITWRITAKTDEKDNIVYTDGEEAMLPVLPNSLLLTESVPVVLKGTVTKEIRLEKLLQSANSTTIKHQSITVEATTNPAWYVVQALPYLIEFPYECAEQTWNRYYANALASVIAASSPRIQQVFKKWKADTTALQSALQKNEELKSILLEETPWVLEAQNEAAQKRKIGLLLDKVHAEGELSGNLAKLRQMQKSSGAFSWFPGGPDDRYITQYILTGIGRLMKTKGFDKQKLGDLLPIITKALPYLDGEIKKEYDAIVKNKFKSVGVASEQTQYLYMRSFYDYYPVPKNVLPAYTYFKTQASKDWQQKNKFLQGMIALALHRSGDAKTPAAILASLKETAIVSEELGMYWKANEQRGGWFWQDSPIETVALLIEAFSEAGNDKKAVTDLQTWLIQNKQTNNWGTTKATADACFAILSQNSSLLNSGSSVTVTVGPEKENGMKFSSNNSDAEDGTGYFRRTIEASKINPQMGMITVQSKSNNTTPVWANIYWQYFENMDKITSAETPLRLSKEIFIEQTTDKGAALVAIDEKASAKVGDKLKIRLSLKVDRDMEYVHLKDLRASGFEPVNVFSGYRWQNGTGYYETTKDASTNFFFDRLSKGTYVFEYQVYVSLRGNFSNGIASVQCMYAPQFTAHSDATRVEVK